MKVKRATATRKEEAKTEKRKNLHTATKQVVGLGGHAKDSNKISGTCSSL